MLRVGLPEEDRVDGFPVPMRGCLLSGAQVFRPARVQLRLQGRRPGGHREGKPGGQSFEITQGLKDEFFLSSHGIEDLLGFSHVRVV